MTEVVARSPVASPLSHRNRNGLRAAAIEKVKIHVRSLLESRSPRALLRYRIMRNIGYEPEIALLPELCDPGKISLDIGANIGIYTWHLAKCSSRVLAFEPNPALAAVLKATFASGVEIHELALSNRRAVADLRFPDHSHALGKVVFGENPGSREDPDVKSCSIKTVPLDDLCLERVGLIKIDTEGHELEVLEGAHRLLSSQRPVLVIEIEDRHRPGALGQIEKMLATFGYAGHFVIHGAMKPLSSYDLELYQNPDNIDALGHRLGTYINNFIFLP